MAHVEPGDAHDDLMERCPTCGKRGCVGYCDPADLWDDDYPEGADRWCREEQWQREAMDVQGCPAPDDGCEPPACDDECLL